MQPDLVPCLSLKATYSVRSTLVQCCYASMPRDVMGKDGVEAGALLAAHEASSCIRSAAGVPGSAT